MNELEKLLRRVAKQREREWLFTFRPYPKQYEFFAAGRTFRERLLKKGNRLGGTLAGAVELAFHLTGEYPDWWPGHKFDRPVVAWVGSESTQSQREVIQKALFGCEEANKRHPRFGTGVIPYFDIMKITNRQAGVRDVMDQAIIRHVSGGQSRIGFKTYEQGRLVLQGAEIDIWWPDEEPKHDPSIYFEGLTRTMAVADGISYMTFSPLNGMTPVVETFESKDAIENGRHMTVMGLEDAADGIWPEGTPWAGQPWKGHIDRERIPEIIRRYPPHERATRAWGVTSAGEGRVFPLDEEQISIPPFSRPKHYRCINGIDFGMNHPFAAVQLWIDADDDCWYVARTYRTLGGATTVTPIVHAAAIKAWGDWVPVAWPHDGLNREKGSGIELRRYYEEAGLKMLPISARYDDEMGGGQKVEPIATKMLERMLTGQFRVFDNCREWFEEFRMFHRKNGVINPIRDDLIKATMYAGMMVRYAVPELMMTRRRHPPVRAPMLEMWR